MKSPIKDFFSKFETSDLVILTEEILNRKHHFLSCERDQHNAYSNVNLEHILCIVVPASPLNLDLLFCFALQRTTSWKVSKYGVFSDPYFFVIGLNKGKYGPEKTPYLDNFYAINQ